MCTRARPRVVTPLWLMTITNTGVVESERKSWVALLYSVRARNTGHWAARADPLSDQHRSCVRLICVVPRRLRSTAWCTAIGQAADVTAEEVKRFAEEFGPKGDVGENYTEWEVAEDEEEEEEEEQDSSKASAGKSRFTRLFGRLPFTDKVCLCSEAARPAARSLRKAAPDCVRTCCFERRHQRSLPSKIGPTTSGASGGA